MWTRWSGGYPKCAQDEGGGSEEWLRSPYLLKGPHVGELNTLPLPGPRNGDGIQSGYITLAVSGAHMRGIGYITRAVWGVPKVGTQSKLAT